jgi:Ca2+-transporting ATPase
MKLAQLGKYLGIMALAICGIIFVIGLVNGIPAMDIFMVAVSLAVSAIPEGLPAIVTIVLSIGVQRLAKKNAIIRRLPAVETLGSASIICSDKTGTLTQNRMTLVRAYLDGAEETEEISAQNTPGVQELLKYGTLCSDGTVVFQDGGEQHIGDPTETAIVLAAYKNGMEQETLNERYPRLAEIPFDSDRKLMTTVNEMDGKRMVIVKGAFDVMAARCSAGNLEAAKRVNDEMSAAALRVLAIGYKEIAQLPEEPTSEALEQNLTFMGLVGMIDPPRPEAKAAVSVCRRAGIKPVMITGDHVVTASAIAKDLGILEEGDRAITGAQLDAMTEQELLEQVEHIAVYARVSPENKIRIVKAWQMKDQVVSMTGDGVNDAPALKAADIGCAMGITGTDVAKGAADMTLTDDNFATIVDAVREGRGIYANIRKVVGFLLGTNIGEVLVVFLSMLLWHEAPLLSMQLLWVNLVTDSFPAIALGMEPVEKDVMEQKPKPKNAGIFAEGFGVQIGLQGVLFGALALIAYQAGKQGMGCIEGGQTLAFMVLSLSQIVQAFNMRSAHSLFQIGPFTNRQLNRAAVFSVVMVAVVLFTPLSELFGLIRLTGTLYGIGVGLILTPFFVMELAKWIGRHSANRK